MFGGCPEMRRVCFSSRLTGDGEPSLRIGMQQAVEEIYADLSHSAPQIQLDKGMNGRHPVPTIYHHINTQRTSINASCFFLQHSADAFAYAINIFGCHLRRYKLH